MMPSAAPVEPRLSLPGALLQRGLQRGLWSGIVALLCVRPLVPESFERVYFSFLGAIGAAPGPTPATSAALDGLLLLLTLAALLLRGLGRIDWRLCSGLALLAAASGISTAIAGDKRIALNASSNLLITLLTGVALVRLCDSRWMWRMALAALLASGAVSAYQCIIQRTVEFPALLRDWEQNRRPELIRQGFDMSEPSIVNFERRMRAAEAYGHLSHPNVQATCLSVWLLLSAAAALHALRSGALPAGGLLALLAGACGFAMYFTGSTGAILSTLGGAGLLALLALTRIGPRRALLGSTALYVLLIALGLGYALLRDTLPHPSLAFRWYYWSAAGNVLAEQPLIGIGRENFRDAYLRHKRIEATEEVQNPHNLWVSLLVDYGPLGLLGGGACCAWLLGRAFQQAPPRDYVPPRLSRQQTQERPSGAAAAAPASALRDCIVYSVPLAAVLATLHALCARVQLAQPGVLIIWATEFVGLWTLSCAAAGWALHALYERGTALRALHAGSAAALCAVLLHALIDFTLLTAAGGAICVLLAAILCAARVDDEAGADQPAQQPARDPRAPAAGQQAAVSIATFSQQRPRLLWSALAICMLAGHTWLVTIPTVRSDAAFEQLTQTLAGAGPAMRAADALESAARFVAADALNPDAPRVVARTLIELSARSAEDAERRSAALQAARDMLQIAIRRNAGRAQSWRMLGECENRLAEVHRAAGQAESADAAIERATAAWTRTTQLDPTHARTRLDAAKAWHTRAQWSGDAQHLAEAQRELQQALRIDATRGPEEATRLTPRERAEIERLQQPRPPAAGAAN